MQKATKQKVANWICLLLLILILFGVGYGYYLRINGNTQRGDLFIGISVLVFTFVLLPIFLVHRWLGKRLQDYTLTKENMKKMRDRGID